MTTSNMCQAQHQAFLLGECLLDSIEYTKSLKKLAAQCGRNLIK